MLNRWQLALGGGLLMLSMALAWQVQGWRYGRQLAQLAQAQAQAEAARLLAERERRQLLERRLEESETRHFKELADVQQSQARLRDRLATADLRLSVLVERDTLPGAVPATTTSAASLDHATVRAGLEPAHAQRIIAITDEGDRGLIALRACQAYVREVRGGP
ncbi:lysis system i-spanin subunit Rz [Pseudomonas sp. BCRC 81390]|uniref:lysis system i-spanin subunit Rz n=1 Tax=Pseudomonas sp. BCRC 81390 TaxID=3054778 RepID=UPI00259842BE|nr:lysis system i-spanin subunit Rz [Pseudomonas sp. BCRC 81390]MDM3888334.1 lysis system i-spanin subunit Rz [Pseudomonas sp. BCRC 81390]